MKRPLYIFLDESGNRDFSPNGTRYFLFSGIVKERPFHAYKALSELRYDLIEDGKELHRFHATEDEQEVRNKVFRIIQSHLEGVAIEALVVEKRKTHPKLQAENRFYPEMLGYFLRHILGSRSLTQNSEVIIFTDKLPAGRQKKEFEKTVRQTLAKMLPTEVKYRVFHHESQSNFDLQIADYCNWAIYRKWDRNDRRPYNLIRSAIRKEFDIFERGTKYYYGGG